MKAAVVLLVLVAVWQTERFQRWINPDTYYTNQVRDYQDAIAFGRMMILEHREAISTLPLTDEADAEVRPMLVRGLEADIAAEEEMIDWYQEQIRALDAALSEFRRHH